MENYPVCWVRRGPVVPLGAGGVQAEFSLWFGVLRSHLVPCSPNFNPLYISLARSPFSRGALIESGPLWLRVGLLEETSEIQGCISSMQTL